MIRTEDVGTQTMRTAQPKLNNPECFVRSPNANEMEISLLRADSPKLKLVSPTCSF